MTESLKGLHGYPSIYNIGHKVLAGFFDDPVLVEEKIDGSQFSFGVFGGEIRCRSKGAKIEVDEPAKMFAQGVDVVKRLAPMLRDGWTYRGEYLQKPKHNTLAYGRIPVDHVILFDINRGEEDYLAYAEKKDEADRLGLEVVPIIFVGMVTTFEQFKSIVEGVSCLGGAPMEGVVLKNYTKFGPDKKALMAKYVREAFREQHALEWKATNPSRIDVVDALIRSLATEARWAKAVQHLRDAGTLEHDPRDIGPLLREIPNDVRKECEAIIKDKLFDWAWPKIQRGVIAGFPQWYKDSLAKQAFEVTR